MRRADLLISLVVSACEHYHINPARQHAWLDNMHQRRDRAAAVRDRWQLWDALMDVLDGLQEAVCFL